MIGVIASAHGSAGPPPSGIVNATNTTVAAQGGDVFRVTKSGGVDGSWDASAVSAAGTSGDVLLSVRALQNDKHLIVGLSTNPAANTSFSSVERSLWIKAGGSCSAGVGGSEDAGTPYDMTQWLFVRRVGSVTQALKGPTANVADAAVFHTFGNLAGTLFADSSLSGAGGAFDIKMEGL